MLLRRSIADAVGADPKRLVGTLLSSPHSSIDMAAYVLTDVPVFDPLTAAGESGVHARLYRQPEDYPPRGAVAALLARLAAAPNVEVGFERGGAANLSTSGLKSRDNSRIETDDPAAVAAFERTLGVAWSP